MFRRINIRVYECVSCDVMFVMVECCCGDAKKKKKKMARRVVTRTALKFLRMTLDFQPRSRVVAWIRSEANFFFYFRRVLIAQSVDE